ncbi:hypothetical protein HBI46_123590 [Parastagonospora nodorum]|nr:hypothetical protein HBI46_123590 [Parastagonospora nodorum]
MDNTHLPINDTNACRFLEGLEVLECVICLQPYGVDRPPITLPTCHHLFHYHCIKQWISTANTTHNQCPTCRAVMFEDEDPPLEDADRISLEFRHGRLEEELERLERFVFAARLGRLQNSSSFDAHDALNSVRTQSTADSVVGSHTRLHQQPQAGNTPTNNPAGGNFAAPPSRFQSTRHGDSRSLICTPSRRIPLPPAVAAIVARGPPVDRPATLDMRRVNHGPQTSLPVARVTNFGHEYSSIALSWVSPAVSNEATLGRFEYLELPDDSFLWSQLTVPHDVDHHRPPWNNVRGRWPYQYMAHLRPYPNDPNDPGLYSLAQAVVNERWRWMRTRGTPDPDRLVEEYSVEGLRRDLGC